MQVKGGTSVTQAIQDSIEALKDKARIARLKLLKSKMNQDQRLIAQLVDNLPPLEPKPMYRAAAENLIDIKV